MKTPKQSASKHGSVRGRYKKRAKPGAAVQPASSNDSSDFGELKSITKEDDPLVVVALARGLSVLDALRINNGPLGNQELATLTKLPKPTVSRITHTLTEWGYLANDARRNTYELGGAAISLGYVALSRLDIRRVARPFMQELTELGNVNLGLGIRDRTQMLYIETCEGKGLVGLRLFNGSRVPIVGTAMGLAYMSALSESALEALLKELEAAGPLDRKKVMADISRAAAMISDVGFCTSIGQWQEEINGAGAPLTLPGGQVLALNLGGPAYLLTEKLLVEKYGPALAQANRKIADTLAGKL